MRWSPYVWAAWTVVVSLAGGVRADDADIAIARIVQDVPDNAQRARKLVDSIKTLDLQKDLEVRILQKAAEYATLAATTSEGLQAGLDALKELDGKAPDRREEWAKSRAELCRRAFRASPPEKNAAAGGGLLDALDALGDQAACNGKWADAQAAFSEGAKIATALARRRQLFDRKCARATLLYEAHRKIEGLKILAAKNPADARFGRQLMEVHAIDMDDPAEAAKFLAAESPQVWQTYLPMALKDPKDLPETACMELCNWYLKSLAASAPAAAKESMLRRARRYCQAALDRHTAKDVALIEMQDRMRQIDTELRAMDPVGALLAKFRYVDMVDLVDLDVDGTEDAWVAVKGAMCTSTKSGGSLRFPVNATGSYQLSLSFAKTQQARDIRFTFPVADRAAQVYLREYYAPGDLLAYDNVTWIRLQFDQARLLPTGSASRVVNPNYGARKWVPYVLDVAVKVAGENVQMAAALNGQKWISWAGGKTGLTGSHHSSGKAFSVEFTNPGLLVSAAKLRPLDGEVLYVRTDADLLRPSGGSSDAPSAPSGSGGKLPSWDEWLRQR